MNTVNLLTPEQTAQRLLIKTTTLAQMRWRGDKRIPWCKLGRSIRYKESDVNAYIENSIVK